jgi:O-antigen ligase
MRTRKNILEPPESDQFGRRKKGICSLIIDYGILGLLIFVPLPAASVREWAVLVIQLVVLIMAIAYVFMPDKPAVNEFLPLVLKRLKWIFSGLFVIVFFQFLPLPKGLVHILSPSSYSYQEMYAVDFSSRRFISLSIIPSDTLQKGLELLTYFLLGFLIIKTVTRRYQIMRILWVLMGMGIFQALYGMFEIYNKNPRILFYKKIYNLDSVTGTFVNRNHFSGYLEMIVPLAIGLIIARIDPFALKSLSWREKFLRLSEKGLSLNILISIGVVLMAVAIIFSQSRSGIFVLVFMFILFFGLTAIYYDIYSFQLKRIKKFLAVSFFVVILISLYVGINSALDRFALDQILQESRPTYWAKTIDIFSSSPLFGTGLGTFGAIYPPMGSETGPMTLVHAHNDYLEYLSELGLVGFSLLFGGIFFMAIQSFLVWRKRKHFEVRGLALGGLIAIICILVHSLTDFNLHIPANMVLFSVVLPLTMVLVYFRRSATPSGKK